MSMPFGLPEYIDEREYYGLYDINPAEVPVIMSLLAQNRIQFVSLVDIKPPPRTDAEYTIYVEAKDRDRVIQLTIENNLCDD